MLACKWGQLDFPVDLTRKMPLNTTAIDTELASPSVPKREASVSATGGTLPGAGSLAWNAILNGVKLPVNPRALLCSQRHLTMSYSSSMPLMGTGLYEKRTYIERMHSGGIRPKVVKGPDSAPLLAGRT